MFTREELSTIYFALIDFRHSEINKFENNDCFDKLDVANRISYLTELVNKTENIIIEHDKKQYNLD